MDCYLCSGKGIRSNVKIKRVQVWLPTGASGDTLSDSIPPPPKKNF
jgi:hypothetical protein